MGTREKILKIFRETREDDTLPIQEARLLEGLIRPDGRPIDDSFKGKRYKNRFLRRLELEFLICLPDEALERRWDLSALTEFVDDRRARPAINLNLADRRYRQSRIADVAAFAVLLIALLPPALLFAWPWNGLALVLLILVGAVLVWLKLADMGHYRTLRNRIRGMAGR